MLGLLEAPLLEGEIAGTDEEIGGEPTYLDNIAIDEDALDKELAALMPEYLLSLEDEEESPAPRRSKSPSKIKQVAVFMGRCPKCGGYMLNAPERQFDQWDEEVYRCFSCSWRTSPVYEWNRGAK